MSDAEFERVISASASHNRRPEPMKAEERRAEETAARKKSPLRMKGVAKRRRAKRGGQR